MNVREEIASRDRNESQDLQNLKRDIEQLRKDLATLSNDVVSNVKAGANQVQDDVTRKSRAAVREAEHKISERPFLSLLISLVLGTVLAKALTSRH